MSDTVVVSDSAADAVRVKFNPSGDPAVAAIKQRTAELISIMEQVRERNSKLAAREASIAITNLQTASMWCVLAVTKGL